MSTWKNKAIECLPEHKKDIEGADIFEVYLLMNRVFKRAYEENNQEKIRSIYAYAEWCFTQKHKELWNAAGVLFYEHLIDDLEIKREIHKWLKHSIYIEIRGLIVWRAGEEEAKKIDEAYKTGIYLEKQSKRK